MITLVGIALAGLLVGFFGGKMVFDKMLTNKKVAAEQEVAKAKKEADEIVKRADYQAQKVVEKVEKELDIKQKKVEQYELRLQQKEEKIDEKMERLEEKKEEYITKKQELEKILDQQKTILSEVAQLSPEQAKQQLFDQIREEQQQEIATFINKYKMIKEEEAKEEAGKIIAKVLPRVAQEGLNEHLVTLVDLPTEDMKGKIIGRE